MKHRVFSLVFALLLVLSLAMTASADVLWEPFDDPYYDYKQANTVAQIYVVPEGSTANLYRSPTTGGVILTMEAGTRIYVGFTQEFDGEIWAVGYPIGNYENEGWFRLARLQQVYDHEMFCEQFGDSFIQYQGQLDGYVIQDAILTWTYPGSGQGDGKITEINDSYSPAYQYVYVDPDGGQWGYVGYFMGHCGWVYLDDPENPNPPSYPQTAENTVTETGPEDAPDGGLIWIVALVAILALATAIVIVILKRKKAQQA